MDDKKLLVAAARALGGRDWSWWTSNSNRRLTFKDGPNTRDGGALSGTVHPYDKWPDVAMAPGVQEFIERASPKAVLGLLDRIAELETALQPFASEAAEWKREARDDQVPHITADDGSSGDAMYCVGDLRRAAAALGERDGN